MAKGIQKALNVQDRTTEGELELEHRIYRRYFRVSSAKG